MTQRTDWGAWNIKIMEIKIMEKTIEIPEGYEARIEGNKVIIELKESEDEWIRKEIIDWMKGGNTYDWQENKEKWIAYLEKQKEQKPVDVSEKIEELCSKYPINKDVMSEETLSAYHQGLSFGATRIAEYLGAQKPAEWSKEDESYLQTVISEMEANKKEAREYEHKKYDTIILWLKSLRPQPHWKPSEEQMEALRFVAYECVNRFLKNEELVSLYEQLKKVIAYEIH